jgi:hypothetical protein
MSFWWALGLTGATFVLLKGIAARLRRLGFASFIIH